jgi:hypothetical protein
MTTVALLDSILARRPEWGSGLAASGPAADRASFLAAHAALGWRLRRATVTLLADEREALVTAGLVAPDRLAPAELARAALLCRGLAAVPPEQHLPLLRELFRTGDNAERESVLKTLILLPQPERFLDIALDACRSAVQTTVEAVGLDNAYPDRHFPPESFRNMVLKAVHLGLPLARIHRLAARLDDELARMAEDYASERRAAGRSIPADLGLLTHRSSLPC